MKPGDVYTSTGQKSVVCAFRVFPRKQGKWIHIRLVGDQRNFGITTVTDNPKSKRYHKALFGKLRRLLLSQGKWPFGEEGSETEE